MAQTVLTIAAEVFPANVQRLKTCITDLKGAIENLADDADVAYLRLGQLVPSLHFASMMVFEDERYDPLLTVELNFDGEAGPFLPQLDVAVMQPYLRAMVSCCKRPADPLAAALYDGVTHAGSKLPLAPLLERMIVRPAVFHQGNRGLTRAQIAQEDELFTAVQSALNGPPLCAATDAVTLHQTLRGQLAPSRDWLDRGEAPRIAPMERAADVGRLVAFVVLALLALSLPGIVLSLVVPPWAAIVVCLALATLLAIPVVRFATNEPSAQTPPPLPAMPRASQLPSAPAGTAADHLRNAGLLVGAIAVYVVVATLILWVPLVAWHAADPGGFFLATLKAVALPGAAGAVFSVTLILAWLRLLERRDYVHDDPKTDAAKLAAIAAAEDQVAQNHMGSIVLVKPGMLRAVLLRFGLKGLGYLLRVVATDGFLASMRTIHFAHWARIGNSGRLLFFSNFDSSWESYLDDFIEKAHPGLTLAWTNGVGFPRTRFLVMDGATNGRLFKAWARHSMTENLFWFSAYPKLSVNQIERQHRVADGLRKTSLSPKEALVWARDL